MTDLADTAARAREVSRQLNEAMRELNESLVNAESAMAKRLGRQVVANVPLTPGTYLVFADGKLFYANQEHRVSILHVSKRYRMLACSRLYALWLAAGGEPLRGFHGHSPQR